MINGISRIVKIMQQRASINRQLRIWGLQEAWSHLHNSNERAKFMHYQVHRSLFSKYLMIRVDRSSTAYLPITLRNNTVWVIFKYLCRIRRYSSLICGKAGAFALIWSKFRCTRESWAYLCDRFCTAYSQIPFGNQNRLGDIQYLSQNMRHRLTY